MDVVILPALRKKRHHYVKVLGRNVDQAFSPAWLMRILRFFGIEVLCGDLTADVYERLDAAVHVYMASSAGRFDLLPGKAGMEQFVIYLLGNGSCGCPESVTDLMVEHMKSRTVPLERIWVSSGVSECTLRKRLYQVLEHVRKSYPEERIVKFIPVGDVSIVSDIEQRLRRMIPGSRTGVSGHMNDSIVFFSPIRVASSGRRSLYERFVPIWWLRFVVRWFPRGKTRMIRHFIRRASPVRTIETLVMMRS